MLAILSPSKTLDFEDALACKEHTQPALLSDAKKLLAELKKFSAAELEELMSISSKLAELNRDRFQSFKTPFKPTNARQALLAFRGDVYTGFELEEYRIADYRFAQKHLRILSGLYGILRPLDLIQAYRLEMKTKLKNPRGDDLYTFWGSKISEELNKAAKESRSEVLVNLASNEYFKAVDRDHLELPIVTPVFQENKGKELRVVALFAKQARGAMANYIVTERIKKPEDLKKFSVDGYRFNAKLSSEKKFVFVR